MNTKVLILLSTYNGEKYLSEMINSILDQEGIEPIILVRDDGSTDRTVEILKNFTLKFRNIDYIEGENLGVIKSFFHLMNEAIVRYQDMDYFAFCDQDDIWHKDKLKVAIKILASYKEDKPSLYISSFQMVDENLHFITTDKLHPNLSLEGAFASNCATGCTMVFNKTLLEKTLISDCDDILMHDYWMYLVCLLSNGYVYYDETPHIYYRQHANNVIGGKGDNFLSKWLTRINKMFLPGDNFKSKLANKLLKLYGDEISDEKREFLHNVANINSLKSKWYLLRNRKYLTGSIDKRLQLIGLILTGKL